MIWSDKTLHLNHKVCSARIIHFILRILCVISKNFILCFSSTVGKSTCKSWTRRFGRNETKWSQFGVGNVRYRWWSYRSGVTETKSNKCSTKSKNQKFIQFKSCLPMISAVVKIWWNMLNIFFILMDTWTVCISFYYFKLFF